MAPISRSWLARKKFWTKWQTLRFSLSKPQVIGPPKPNKRKYNIRPFIETYPKIPLKNVLVYQRLPDDESVIPARILIGTGLFLNRCLPPMRSGLPEIDEDSNKALDFGLSPEYRKKFRVPSRPEVFAGNGPTELGELAVKGPYCVFLERGEDGNLQWDFMALGDCEHHEGICSLGIKVMFSESDETGLLKATKIESREYGIAEPGSPKWEQSVLLAICAATTHVALIRHFNYVHLISGNHWDIALRNNLASDHPIYRLIWPQIYNSLYTNYGVTKVQLLPDGDFVNMYSFTHTGLMQYYDEMYERYDVIMMDPELDWQRRGLTDSKFTCPSQENLVELFTIMHDHAKRYLYEYYKSDAELRNDTHVANWLKTLNELIPNGISQALITHLTRDALARTIGAYIYEGIVIHELAGTALWDYQLWPDKNPCRIYRNGKRMPVDVYQRIIDNNFALQLERAPLLADYGAVALDARGRELFTRFSNECKALQAKYDQQRAESSEDFIWRMEPSFLEIGMNG